MPVAVATPHGTLHRHVRFRVGERALIREGTAYRALSMLLGLLEGREQGPFYTDDEVWTDKGVVLRGSD